ncbi:MAG TPA: hypothetical protein VJ717_19145 [Gemmatimonadaceae bacterium]|nr:hypothetical protein [Gemmatimonadaceae bacterium]
MSTVLKSVSLPGIAIVLMATACSVNQSTLPGDRLAVGTWGGENAGVLVNDTTAHVHVACTLGNFPMPVQPNASGEFTVAGTYVLRAFPVHVGPDLPAQFTGRIQGTRLTLTIAVNDTVEKKTVQLGPVDVTFGREPRMGPCPICKDEMRDTRSEER